MPEGRRALGLAARLPEAVGTLAKSKPMALVATTPVQERRARAGQVG